MRRVLTQDGDMIDYIAWKNYGGRQDVVPLILEANPGLARLGPVLPAGITVVLPDIPAPAAWPVVRIWS